VLKARPFEEAPEKETVVRDANPQSATRGHALSWWVLALRGLVAILLRPGGPLLAWPHPSYSDSPVRRLCSGRRRLSRHRRVQIFRARYAQALTAHRRGTRRPVRHPGLFWSGLTALALLYIIAFWAIFSGIASRVMAVPFLRTSKAPAYLGAPRGRESLLCAFVDL
jgi:hypothetical protein